MAKKKEAPSSPFVPVEEQPYPIPENWCWVKLEDVSEIIMGQSPAGSDTTDDSSYIPLIGGAADMGIMYPLATRYTKVPTKISKDGDLILCIRATLGKPIFSDGEYCLGRGVAAVRPYTGPKEYYRYFFLNFEQYLYDNATGTTFAQVSSKILQKMPVPLSPRPEQQRIVDRIESLFAKLDEAKEKAQAVVDGFELRKSATLHKAFTGELTERWRKEHGVGLDSWNVISFGNLILNGPQNGLYKPKDAYGNGTKILRIDGFYDGYVEDWGTLKRLTLSAAEIELYELHLDEIVINRVNSMPYLGKSALIRELPETCVFESNMMRISLNKERVISEFIIRYLNSPAGLAELRKNAKQAVNQASINQKDVKNVIVKLPASDEQAEIVRILDSVLTQEQQAKEAAEAVLSQIDTMKKAILARAFRGELGTNDPAEEWAGKMVKKLISEEA